MFADAGFGIRSRGAVACLAVVILAVLGGIPAPASARLAEDPDADRAIVYTDYVLNRSETNPANSALYVLQGDADPLPFYENPGTCDEYDAAFSPDGTKIAFTSCWSIVVAPVEGLTPLSEVTRLPCPKAWCRDAAWSPDGSQIVFAASPELYPPSKTAWDLWVVNVDGSESRELYAGRGGQRHPSWSPDGRRIAFSNNATGGQFDYDILSVNPRGRRLRVIAGRERLEREPVYSPNGRKIVFVRRDNSGLMNLSVKNLSTGRLRAITPGGYSYIEPAWSPSGYWVGFSDWDPEIEDFRLLKVRSDGSSSPVVLRSFGHGPTWQP